MMAESRFFFIEACSDILKNGSYLQPRVGTMLNYLQLILCTDLCVYKCLYVERERNSVELFVRVISCICRYAKHSALLGIELLNEPSAASVPLDILVSYYKQGYEVVRKRSSSAYVIVCQRIGDADPLELYQASIGSHNIVVDLHYYSLFDTFFVNMSSVDNIQFIYQSREAQLKALNSANGPLVFIGKLKIILPSPIDRTSPLSLLLLHNLAFDTAYVPPSNR